MKKAYFILIVSAILTGVFVVIQIRPAYTHIKQEINNILIQAIDIDLKRRLNSSDSSFIPPMANTAKSYALVYYTNSQYRLITDAEKESHSKLRTTKPINPAILDKTLNSILAQKGLSAKTSIRYTDLKENTSIYSRQNHSGTIPSAIIKTGTHNEIEIQTFITPSLAWIIATTPVWIEINIILFVVLICINLVFLISHKQQNTKTECMQSVAEDHTPVLCNKNTTTDSLQTETNNTSKESYSMQIYKTIVKLDNGDYQIGLFYLDNKNQLLITKDESLYIGKQREYLFLLTLLKAKNHTISAEKVAEILDIKNYKNNNQLNTSVSRLRKLFKTDSYIKIVRIRDKYILTATHPA